MPREREVAVDLVEDGAGPVWDEVVVASVLDRVCGHDDGRGAPNLRHRPHAAQEVDKLGVVIGAFAVKERLKGIHQNECKRPRDSKFAAQLLRLLAHVKHLDLARYIAKVDAMLVRSGKEPYPRIVRVFEGEISDVPAFHLVP